MIIGIAGKARSGKSTAGDVLVSQGFVRGKFANGLKEMLRALLRYRKCTEEFIERCVEGDLKEKPLAILGGKSPRHAMQTLGRWGRDDLTEDYWIDTEFDARKHDEKVVFDDLRHDNEETAIVRDGGLVLHLIGRGGIEGEHFSESFKPKLATVIENTGTKEELQTKVRRFALDASWVSNKNNLKVAA